jgi:hypothetical protein
MQNENSYNGWSNYATWRVSMEMFDGFDVQDAYPAEVAENDIYGLSLQLEGYADNIVCDPFADSRLFAVDYARAFLQGVNWYEIAEHMLRDVEQ